MNHIIYWVSLLTIAFSLCDILFSLLNKFAINEKMKTPLLAVQIVELIIFLNFVESCPSDDIIVKDWIYSIYPNTINWFISIFYLVLLIIQIYLSLKKFKFI